MILLESLTEIRAGQTVRSNLVDYCLPDVHLPKFDKLKNDHVLRAVPNL